MAEATEVNATETHSEASGLDAVFADEGLDNTGPSDPETESESTEAPTEEAETAEETPAEAGDPELDAFIAKKGIDRDKFNEYAERYRVTPEMLKANPSLRYLVLDKLNGDAELAKKAQPEVKEAPKQDPPGDLAAHFQQVAKEAEQFNDQKVVEHLVSQLESAKDTKTQVQVLTAGMHNYLKTAGYIRADELPQALQRLQEKQQQEQQAVIDAHTKAYEAFRAKNPALPEDPAAAYEEAAKVSKAVKNPNLSPEERMEMVALLLAGRKVEAEKVAQAAEAGKRQGLEASKKAELGKALGAGKSNGTLGQAKPRNNDDIFGEGVAEYRRREKV